MRYFYDLHIHTALSPCADKDQTPQNIIGMAQIAGLDIIAVTDHNSCGNARSVMEAAKETNLLVIPGMELTTEEEIHVILLFPDIKSAEQAWREIEKKRFKIKNKSDIFGRQLYMDAQDNVVGEEESLLITATNISFDQAVRFAAGFGGAAFPAHIDKPANSVLSILGGFGRDAGYSAVELTVCAPEPLRQKFIQEGYDILIDSDSHHLGILNDRTGQNAIELPECTAKALIEFLRKS